MYCNLSVMGTPPPAPLKGGAGENDVRCRMSIEVIVNLGYVVDIVADYNLLE